MTDGRVTHGEYGTPLHTKWKSMIARCYIESDTSYPRYGARGIKVCGTWRYCYRRFRDWALANGYDEGLTLERRDVEGDYSPQNCLWIPWREQTWNRRDSPHVEAFGEVKSIPQWSHDERCQVNYHTLRARLARGMEPEKAIAGRLLGPGGKARVA